MVINVPKVAAKPRSSPVAFPHPVSVSTSTRAELPSDWKYAGKEKITENASFRYKTFPRMESAKVLLLDYSYHSKKDHINPGDLAAVTAQLEDIHAKLGFQLSKDKAFYQNPQTLKRLIFPSAIGLLYFLSMLYRFWHP